MVFPKTSIIWLKGNDVGYPGDDDQRRPPHASNNLSVCSECKDIYASVVVSSILLQAALAASTIRQQDHRLQDKTKTPKPVFGP